MKTAAVMEPATPKAAEGMAELVSTLKYIEQWARYNDGFIRQKCIEALRKAGEWAQ